MISLCSTFETERKLNEGFFTVTLKENQIRTCLTQEGQPVIQSTSKEAQGSSEPVSTRKKDC